MAAGPGEEIIRPFCRLFDPLHLKCAKYENLFKRMLNAADAFT